MDPRTTERVERWDSRPFTDGYDGLSDLADREFSGAVTAAGTWLFMLNGRVVGIVDGTIEDFDGATGTTYEAPDPALPLLCSMEETGGETRAKYYTNETPLEEVDDTLSSGSFTGYVELSEGVLSGDYYAVYYGGRRMAAAYIGNAQRLLTGEEAFERAADEVGIYEVVDVDVDVTDVPGGEDPSPAETAPADGETRLETADGEPAATDAEADEATDSGATTPSSASRPSTSTSITDTETTAETGSAAEAEGATDDAATDSERTVESSSPSTSATTDDEAVDQRFGIDLESQSGVESEPEPELESESEPEPDPASNPDSTVEETPSGITTADGESAESAPPGITDDLSAPLVDEAADTSTNETDVPESEPDGPSDDEGATTSARSVDEDVDSTPVDEAETDRSQSSSTSSPTSTSPSTSSSPNPDDLEAAAEELSESGVPWSSNSGADSNSTSDSTAGSETNAESGTPTAEEIDLTVDEIADTDADESTAELEERFKQEEQWRETRSIPSIDPDKTAGSAAPQSNRRGGKKRARKQQKRTQRRSRGRSSTGAGQSPDRDSQSSPSAESRAESGSGSGSGSDSGTSAGSETSSPTRTDAERTDRTAQSQSSPGGRPDTGQQSQSDATTRQSSRSRSGAGAHSPADSDALESDMLEREDKIDRLTQQVDDLEQRRDELETKAADLEHERDRLESENQELTETVERLESRIDELESELERVRSADAAGAVADATDARGTELSPQRALAGTNLFVRYGSKSQPTLEAAHDGDVDAASVNSNLVLEHHTQFDEADVSVDGVPYEEFLTSTMEYQFVDWLTGTLLYEIRDTGHATSLGDLYDVIPRIDRAELHSSISLEDDDTDEVPDQVTFDVVAFDKRGTPLVAANLNDSRDPATREMLIELEETASAVNANFPDLGAAIVVTSSFFDPGALEIAEQATSGGFLSRGSKLSYVNLSRKQGYHMCLVESRSGGFHMNVPEL